MASPDHHDYYYNHDHNAVLSIGLSDCAQDGVLFGGLIPKVVSRLVGYLFRSDSSNTDAILLSCYIEPHTRRLCLRLHSALLNGYRSMNWVREYMVLFPAL